MFIYPTIQTVIQDTVFLMAESISEHYVCYQIRYFNHGSVLSGYISQKLLSKYIDDNTLKVLSKPNFASGAEFIKIPIKYLDHVRPNLEPSKDISNQLF